ncbi:unnamed protein product, partial [Gongylonema pulchrum]
MMVKLQNLSEQLDPLETAYADVRFYDVDVEQTQQQYENLMSAMNNELQEESILNESAQQLAREIERLNIELASELVQHEQLEEILNHQLPALQAQLQLLRAKDDEASRARIHVHRMSQPAVEALLGQMNRICELVREKLDELAGAEKQEKIMMIRLELEALSNEECDEERIAKLEKQLQELHFKDEETEVLVSRVHELRIKKNKRVALANKIEGRLIELVNRMNMIDSNLRAVMDDRERRKMAASTGVDMQISALESALSEAAGEILPLLNELCSQSHHENIIIPSIQLQLENVQKFIEKCK